METKILYLKNGLRVVFHPFVSHVSHACILINAGSRDEASDTFGIAHFIEHLLFKKTKKRSTTQILNHLELVGGDLNAFTTKEYTCIHASFLRPHLSRAMDLFEDITFHSIFPEKDIEKEKGVVLDEITSYQDTPEEAILDDFEDIIFHNHPLGHNILGTQTSVQSFKKNNILRFLQLNYNPENVIVAISGNYTIKHVHGLAERYFGDLKNSESPKPRTPPDLYKAEFRSIQRAIHQSHMIIGARAYPVTHEKKLGLALLSNLLGGSAMTSRLNMEIREKRGIAYNVDSLYMPYQDTGLFSVYFGTDPEKSDKALRLVMKEFKKLRFKKVGPVLLQQAKRKFMGEIALAEENRMSLITSMAKNLNDHNYIEHLPDLFKKINGITANDLQDIANDILEPGELSILKFSP